MSAEDNKQKVRRLLEDAFTEGNSEVVDEGDRVVTRYTISGTHQGEFFGVPATGKRIEISGITIDRFDESGKMVEEWPEYDLLGAVTQLGAIPEPQQAGS